MRALVSIFCVLYIVVAENCDKKGTLLYEDLGCVPNYVKSQTCPVSYTCQGLEPWKNRCYFRGKTYNDNEIVNDSLSSLSCDKGCFCIASNSGSDFACASRYCRSQGLRAEGCFPEYSLDSCCPVGTICPSRTDPGCVVEGKRYREGQKFAPKESCVKCICQKGFTGALEEPLCKRISCGTQLKYSRFLQNACAPLYSKEYSNVRCCPDSWVCGDGSEVIQGQAKSGKVTLLQPSANVCIFGKRSLRVGEFFTKSQAAVFVKTVARVVCKCEIPPLLTCTETY